MPRNETQTQVQLRKRREVAESLRDIFRILNSNRPVEEVLDYIIEHAQKVLDADNVGIYRIEPFGDEYIYLRPSRGLSADYLSNLAISVNEGVVSSTILKKKPLVVTDSISVAEASASLRMSDEQKELVRRLFSTHRALLGVPFIIKGEVYGGIVMFYDEPREFSQEEIELALAIGDQTALAIENALNKEQIEQRVKVAGALRDVFTILNSNRPVEEVLDYIIEHAKRTLEADDVGIYRLDLIGDNLYLRPTRGLTATYITDLVIPTTGSVISATIMQKKPLVVTDADALIAQSSPILPNDEQRDLLRQMFTAHRAAIAVPFVIKNEIYGGIGLYYTNERQFTQDEIDLAITIGAQAALAIENAQAREQIEQRAKVAEALRDVFKILNSNRPFTEALEYIVERTGELLGADSVGLYKISDDMTQVTLDAGWGMGAETMTGMVIPFNAGAMDEKYGREPLVLPDVRVMIDTLMAASPTMVTNKESALDGVKSMIATPVTIRDKTYGSLHLYYAEQRTFSEDDVELAKTFGDQAALAIENKQAREQAERRAKVAESLRDMMVVLNSDMPINDVLDQVVKQASRLLGASAVAVYKLFPEEGILRIQAAEGLSPEYCEQMEIPVGEAAVGQAVLLRQPVQVFDIAASFPGAEQISANPLSSSLIEYLLKTYRSVQAVPLIIKDEVYGGITMYYPEPREYSAEDIDLASMFANHVALAIEHERLDTRSQEAAVSSERNRLARELHDAVTQTLFSASLIAEVLPKIWEKDNEEGLKRIGELRNLTRGALAEMRTLLLELRPAALLDSDLGDLLQQLADAATTSGRVPVDVVLKGNGPVADDVKVTFYRVAQEALNNVAKHSNATSADITLIREPDSVKLRVLDNGRGFTSAPEKPDSLGLGIMAERAASIGADLNIDSTAGQGTAVTLIWKKSEA